MGVGRGWLSVHGLLWKAHAPRNKILTPKKASRAQIYHGTGHTTVPSLFLEVALNCGFYLAAATVRFPPINQQPTNTWHWICKNAQKPFPWFSHSCQRRIHLKSMGNAPNKREIKLLKGATCVSSGPRKSWTFGILGVANTQWWGVSHFSTQCGRHIKEIRSPAK